MNRPLHGTTEWRAVFTDGYAHTIFELDPAGRVVICGRDDDEFVHLTSHSADVADRMADVLRRMAAHIRGEL